MSDLPIPPGALDIEFSPLAVPKIIFDEIAKRHGVGEPYEIDLFHAGGVCTCLKIRLGENAALAFRQRQGFSMFALLDGIPTKENEETVFEPRAYLELLGSATDGHVWTSTDGTLLRHTVKIECRQDAAHPFAPLAALIILRAHQLLRDPQCIHKSFWSKDQHSFFDPEDEDDD